MITTNLSNMHLRSCNTSWIATLQGRLIRCHCLCPHTIVISPTTQIKLSIVSPSDVVRDINELSIGVASLDNHDINYKHADCPII